MKHATITFFAALLGVLVAMLAFHFYRVWDDRRTEQIRATVVAEVDQQGRALDSNVAAEQRAIELIRADVVAMASARVAVAESFMTTGKMPTSNAEAGLPEANTFRGRSLRAAQVVDDGRIRLLFDGESGHDGGIIELVPDVGHLDSMGVQWRCETRDYPQIIRAVPSCDYLPAAVAN